MSWSMSLGGPKEVILKELGDAAAVINQASESLNDARVGEGDSVYVSVSGYVSWDGKGIVASNTSHNISVTRYVPPVLEPVPDAAPSDF